MGSSLRDIVQEKGSASFGRAFTIDGPLNIEWHWSAPRIHAEKIRLANTPGAKDPYMLEIGSLDFRIRIWKLLFGRTEFPDISIENARLILEKKDGNHKNWDLPIFSRGKAAVDAALPDNRHDFPFIGSFIIKKSSLIYRDGVKGLNLDLNLDNGRSEGGDGQEKFSVDGKGTLQGQVFEIKGEGGSLHLLRDTSQDFPLTLDLKMGPTHVELQGIFRDPVKVKGIDATLKLSGDNMADLFYLTSIPLPPTPPYTLSGHLGKEDEVWSFEKFKGKVGDSDLAGDLTYDTGGERGFLKASLASQKMDLDDLGGFIGMAPSVGQGETASPEQARQARKEEASPRLLPDVPINLKRLRASDMEVAIKVDKLYAPSLPFNGLDVDLKLDHGLLRIDPMNLSLADGTARGSLTLNGAKDNPEFATNLDLKRLKISRFFAGTRFEKESQGTFGGHIELKGSGLSLADILGGSDGRIVMLTSGGQISLLLIEASDLDIAEAAPLFFGDDKVTQIRCGVGDFKVTDGTLYSRIFVLDTTDTNLQGRVDINLKNETIDAALDAQPKDASILSLQSPILVTGRLKHPDVTLDIAKAGLRTAGAAALGAILTPLAAVIPFIEVGLGEDSDCGSLITHAQKEVGPVQ
jgi:uncharacterized protein involved in outer membrane biogenesis